MDADGGHRRRPRRGPRADRRQRRDRPSAAATAVRGAVEADPSFLLPQWQDSVVALWTPTTHASGFLIDAKGLIATNQRVIGTATSVEVQLTPDRQGGGARPRGGSGAGCRRPLDRSEGVAASVRPVPLGCARKRRSRPSSDGQELFTIGAPLREQKGMTSGTVSRVEPHAIVSDFRLASGSAGGPVFTAGGGVVGITSIVDGPSDRDEGRDFPSRPHRRCVRRRRVCGEEDEGCGAAGRHASSRGAGAAVSRGRAQGRRRNAARAA